MSSKVSFFLAAALLSFSIAAYGHHSFAATYHQDKTVTIEGRLVQFSFRNPHSIVNVESTDPKTGKIRWTIEWAGSWKCRRYWPAWKQEAESRSAEDNEGGHVCWGCLKISRH